MASHIVFPAPWQTEDDKQHYATALSFIMDGQRSCHMCNSHCGDNVTQKCDAVVIWSVRNEFVHCTQIGDIFMHGIRLPTTMHISKIHDIIVNNFTQETKEAFAYLLQLLRIRRVEIGGAYNVVCMLMYMPGLTHLTIGCSFPTPDITQHITTLNSTCIYGSPQDMRNVVACLQHNNIKSIDISSRLVTQLDSFIEYLASRRFDSIELTMNNVDENYFYGKLVGTDFFAHKLRIYKMCDGIMSLIMANPPQINIANIMTDRDIPAAFWNNTLQGLQFCGLRQNMQLALNWINNNTYLTYLDLGDIDDDIAGITAFYNTVLANMQYNGTITHLKLPPFLDYQPNALMPVLQCNTTLTFLTIGRMRYTDLDICLKHTCAASQLSIFYCKTDQIFIDTISQYTNIFMFNDSTCITNKNYNANNTCKLLKLCQAAYKQIE